MRDVVLVEYYTIEDLTLLFVARSSMDKPEVFEIPLPLRTIKEFLTNHYSEHGDPGDPQDAAAKGARGKIRQMDEEEFNSVLGPLVAPLGSDSASNEPLVRPGDVIWFVPHGDLHYVPLHALKLHERHIIERNPVCYTPSSSAMKYCLAKRRTRNEREALVLGDSRADQPLPFGGLEASKVAALLGTTPLLGAEADKRQVIDALADPARRERIGVIHFACHGYFRPEQPMLSGVALSNGGGDSMLTAEDFFGLQMRTDLVSLSACDGGVSERRSGDELIGLVRALIYAGTPSVLVSLWAVDDFSTSLMMDRFYSIWLRGVGKAEALQQAQCWLRGLTRDEVLDRAAAERRVIGEVVRKDSRNRQARRLWLRLDLLCEELLEQYEPGEHPFDHLYYWAPFVLVGDWR